MDGRNAPTKTALLAGLIVLLGACTTPKPRIDQRMEDAAAKQRAAQAVVQGMDKETAPPGTPIAGRAGTQTLKAGDVVWMQPGKSKVLQVPFNVTRVSIGNPDLAGVVVLGPRSVLINAKELASLSPAQQQANQITGSQTVIARSGLLSAETFTPPPQIQETTIILWDNANHTQSHTVYVTNFLAEEVLLDVTVAELDLTKMEERGVDFQKLGGFKFSYFMGGLGGPSAPPGGGSGGGFFGQLGQGALLPTVALQNASGNVTAIVTMLQTEGMANILAQPKLVALSGQNAVFQVGGEIPIRIVTAFSAEVEFKAFGTLLNFVPYVSDDGSIVLTVTPEVSEPDFNSLVEGVPTFRTRRASTTAKLNPGESLVIGGLTQRSKIENERGIPYLKDIPAVGYLFRTTTYNETKTELMVIVTPHLVKSLPPDTDLTLPTDRPPMQRSDVKTAPNPAEVTRPRLPQPAINSSKPIR